jgi:hypothetical protein
LRLYVEARGRKGLVGFTPTEEEVEKSAVIEIFIGKFATWQRCGDPNLNQQLEHEG